MLLLSFSFSCGAAWSLVCPELTEHNLCKSLKRSGNTVPQCTYGAGHRPQECEIA